MDSCCSLLIGICASEACIDIVVDLLEEAVRSGANDLFILNNFRI